DSNLGSYTTPERDRILVQLAKAGAVKREGTFIKIGRRGRLLLSAIKAGSSGAGKRGCYQNGTTEAIEFTR
ncbi:MAG TPA: hypothetical protein VM912_05310, partial [Terriglobales bacterium]|nr:hypothetical protein [Terriglobales bacterium]